MNKCQEKKKSSSRDKKKINTFLMAKEYLMKTEVPIKSPFVCLFQF